jgi:hypothetical protein
MKEHQRLANTEGDLEPKHHEGESCFMMDDAAVKELRKSPNLNKGLMIFCKAYEAHKGQLEARDEKPAKAPAKKTSSSDEAEKHKSKA